MILIQIICFLFSLAENLLLRFFLLFGGKCIKFRKIDIGITISKLIPTTDAEYKLSVIFSYELRLINYP